MRNNFHFEFSLQKRKEESARLKKRDCRERKRNKDKEKKVYLLLRKICHYYNKMFWLMIKLCIFFSCRRDSSHCWAWGEWAAWEGANRTREATDTWVKGLMNFHLNLSEHAALWTYCVWQVWIWWLIDTCQCLQDRERREDELNELRHILDENHFAVSVWEAECREKAKVQELRSFIQIP